jgi:lactate dehydrogenase-like 2-hydroxyacid dehydrogenase
VTKQTGSDFTDYFLRRKGMFEKLVAIEPVSLTLEAQKELKKYAKRIILYEDIPEDEKEIVKRIGDADGVLVSYTSQIGRNILEQCSNIRYVGMCCSLYSEASANVDIACARERGIQVLGIRDYGDRGVVEYVLYQLVRILHGFDFPMWQEEALELTGMPVGIIGLGVSGGMVAFALQMMGAEVSYYSRTRKPEKEAAGIKYLPLEELLTHNQVVITCLNKNVILLHEEQFQCLGNKKILMNTSIGTASDTAALAKWLECEDNLYCCDTEAALGDATGKLIQKKNVVCMKVSVGRTKQAFQLLSRKVLDNIRLYLEGQGK